MNWEETDTYTVTFQSVQERTVVVKEAIRNYTYMLWSWKSMKLCLNSSLVYGKSSSLSFLKIRLNIYWFSVIDRYYPPAKILYYTSYNFSTYTYTLPSQMIHHILDISKLYFGVWELVINERIGSSAPSISAYQNLDVNRMFPTPSSGSGLKT